MSTRQKEHYKTIEDLLQGLSLKTFLIVADGSGKILHTDQMTNTAFHDRFEYYQAVAERKIALRDKYKGCMIYEGSAGSLEELLASFPELHTRESERFEVLGNNLWILSITHPLEILLAKKLGTDGKRNLERLLHRFVQWLKADSNREAEYAKMGVRISDNVRIWTELWPWRK